MNHIQLFSVQTNYDLCLKDLESALDQAVEIARAVVDKKWNDLLPKILGFVTEMSTTVECFLHPPKGIQENPVQCVVDQLKKAYNDFSTAIQYLQEQKFEEMVKYLKLAV